MQQVRHQVSRLLPLLLLPENLAKFLDIGFSVGDEILRIGRQIDGWSDLQSSPYFAAERPATIIRSGSAALTAS